MANTHHDYLVGYLVQPGNRERKELFGTAEIDGNLVEHKLTPCAQPPNAIDVGRNNDGDVVWVSAEDRQSTYIPPLNTDFEVMESFDPEITPTEIEDEYLPPTHRRRVLALTEKFSRRKILVISTGFVTAVLVFIGLNVTFPPLDTADAAQKIITTEMPSTPTVENLISDPAEAAIDFVVSGEIPGITLPEEATRDSLQATVVSSSGEIVLVDVQVELNEGLTTFATLLLQKTGTAWRIREVFDPR